LRLQNGLYIQRHAPMFRISIPYGMLSSRQLRMLARIARVYDRGYGHFSTRQNLQLNWPRLEDVPDMLADLASVEMHAIQTSGNDVRNITSDHFAGVAQDEVVDPRPYCELIRQWAALHPEFAYLPRKFKIAITGAVNDRTAVWLHDVGLVLTKNNGEDLWRPILTAYLRALPLTDEELAALPSLVRLGRTVGLLWWIGREREGRSSKTTTAERVEHVLAIDQWISRNADELVQTARRAV